jgi:hypothetical protein
MRLALVVTGLVLGGCGPGAQDDRMPVQRSFLTLQTLKGNAAGCQPNYTCFSTLDGLVTEVGKREAREHYYPASQQSFGQAVIEDVTFADWKTRFQFPQPTAGESLQEYRARAHVTVYYNQNELGLGRELGCATFYDSDDTGAPAQGVACYVTNYGESFNDYEHAIADARLGRRYRNTVVLSYQPSLPVDYQVQFAAFDGQPDGGGRLKSSAQLDLMGDRPVPQICTNCHGGVYDPSRRLVKNAHFLPANVFAVRYGADAPYRREDQSQSFRFINDLALAMDLQLAERGRPDVLLTQAQRDYLRALYALSPDAKQIPPGSREQADGVPPSWSDTSDSRTIWRYAILPYCATCHNALPPWGGNPVDNYRDFTESPQGWAAIRALLCERFEMPHAQPTLNKFWSDYLTVDGSPRAPAVLDAGGGPLLDREGRPYRSAKRLLAATMNQGIDDCGYLPGNGCNLGGSQAFSNFMCGDPTSSGRWCNLQAAGGDGECQDGCGARTGGVGCPKVDLNVQECATSGRCEPCGRLGQPPCTDGCHEGSAVPGLFTCQLAR